MDFRGRVYPCPPHLNHLGSDMARSLLCFAKGEPLGSNGLNWLKVSLKIDLLTVFGRNRFLECILFNKKEQRTKKSILIYTDM